MATLPQNPRFFASRYPGQCQHCKGKIQAGDRIAWVRNEYLAHEACHTNEVNRAEARTPSEQQRADDIYWKNRAAAEERKREEAAYRAKMKRDRAAEAREPRNEPPPF